MLDGQWLINAVYEAIESGNIPEVDGRALIYPADSPGMPSPGPDILSAAKAIFPEDSTSVALTKLYFRLLYAKRPIMLSVAKGSEYLTVPVLPGHKWGYKGTIRKSKVMIIGKMPGREEIQHQMNFVGSSGALLLQVFQECGIDKQQCKEFFVTNTIRWNAEGLSTIPQSWVADCAPLLHEELRLVQPDIILLLGNEAVKAVFGYRASARMLASRDLTLDIPLHRRGESERIHTAKVFIALHPAAVCRRPEQRPVLVNDISRFAQYFKYGTVAKKNDNVKFDVVSDKQRLDDIVTSIIALPGVKRIAIDLEWEGHFPTEPGSYVRTIQISYKPSHAIVIVLRGSDGLPRFEPDIQSAIDSLNRLFERNDLQLGGAHIAADMPWIKSIGLKVNHLLTAPKNLKEFVGGKWPGLFDVALAEHAYNETGPFDLEALASIRCGYSQWSHDLAQWKSRYAAEKGIDISDLAGYGACPDDILIPYAAMDAAVTRELMDVYCELLNSDRFGNSCWRAFHNAILALPAFVEMHCTGVVVDRDQIDKLTDAYCTAYAKYVSKLREEIKWPDFNPRSYPQTVELLFGEQYLPDRTGKQDKKSTTKRRPEGAVSLGLTPVKTTSTGKGAHTDRQSPSTDKQTCGILATQHQVAGLLRDVRFIDHVLKSVLRPPKVIDGSRVYDGGIASFIRADGKVHSFFKQLVETGRASSARPPLQNLAKRREDIYQRLLGDLYIGPLRSVICASPGHVLVEGDFVLAELLCMGVISREQSLIEHCYRAALPPDHPDHYDLHSQMAVKAFNLRCEPTKKGLAKIGASSLRVAAKGIVFGSLYGRTPEAVARQCQEEGNNVTVDDARRILDTWFSTYPRIADIQQLLRDRVLNEGWIATCWGRMRRFYKSDDQSVIAAQQREAMNFPPQSMVADAMNMALYNLYTFPDRDKLGYKIVLQLHDACMLEVPESNADVVAREVMPLCMSEMVKFPSCTLDGIPYKDSPLYSFKIDISVFKRWSETD